MSKLVRHWKRYLPTPESIVGNRWMRPFAGHFLTPALWRFTRRSVPRGVAVGLLIAPIIPVAHMLLAALAAVPTRANLVIAAGVTWLINPLTIVPFYYAANHVGRILLHTDSEAPAPQVPHPVVGHIADWLTWLLSQSGPLVLGTIVLSVVLASTGYLVASFGWRWNIGRKWRARAADRASAALAA